MKRLLTFLLVLILLIPASLAENVSAMSDADLKALYKSIKEELMNRKLWEESTLPAGVYQAGLNLPEGTYHCKSSEKNNSVILFANYEDFLNNKYFEYFYPNDGDEFVMTLKGTVCYYVKKPCIVMPFLGFNW